MKFKNFKYTKKKDGETKGYLVMTMHEDDTSFSGIEFGKLNDEEMEEVMIIQKEYEAKIKPFVDKAYRKFLKENVIDDNCIVD